MRTVRLYAYRVPVSTFQPFGEHGHAYLSTVPVRPLGPAEPVGDLLDLHIDAGVELPVVDNL